MEGESTTMTIMTTMITMSTDGTPTSRKEAMQDAQGQCLCAKALFVQYSQSVIEQFRGVYRECFPLENHRTALFTSIGSGTLN